MNQIRANLVSASALAAVLAVPGIALAQAVPPTSGAEAPPAADASVGDIVVTARKRSERARDVPVAITAITGTALQARNISDIVNLTVTVPGLMYSTASTQPQLFIRGVGSGTNEGFDQSVAKFENNIYFGGPQDAKIPVFDVERLEVLKGPQVIDFGNSATAGAINITTVKPGSQLAADLSGGYEFVDHEVKLQGGVTVPLAQNMSFRLAGIYDNLMQGDAYNSLLNTHEPKTKTWAIRPTLKFDPTPDLSVVLMGEYDNFFSYGSPYLVVRQPLAAGAPQYSNVGNTNVNNEDTTSAPVSSEPIGKQVDKLVSLDIRYNALGGSFVSTTAYRTQKTLEQLGLPEVNDQQNFFQHDLQRYNQFSQEIRFNGTYGKFDLSLDGYYENNNRHIDSDVELLLGGLGVPLPPIGVVSYFDQNYKKYSAMIDGTYHLGGGFSVSAGVRYARNEKNAGEQQFGASIVPHLGYDTTRALLNSYESATANALLPAVGFSNHLFPFGSLNLKENDWQPQAIVQYKFGENMAYVKYVDGAKAGGFDSSYGHATPDGATFAKEKGSSFEIGLKGQTVDRVFDYALTAFRETFIGLQQSYLSGTSFLVTNAGEARSQGFEVELNVRPVHNLRLGFNGSYLDAHYVAYTGAPCNTSETLATPNGCTQDRSGTPLQFASKWSGTFSADYQEPVDKFIVSEGVNVFARSSYNAGAVNDSGAVQHGFAMLDFHIDAKPEAGPWTVSVFGRNLTNVRYLTYVVSPPGNSTALLSPYERGRQIGVRFGLKF